MTRYQQKDICVYVCYSQDLELRIFTPERLNPQVTEIVEPPLERPIKDVKDLLRRIRAIENLDEEVTVFLDAEEYMGKILYRDRVRNKVEEIRRDPKNHPLRNSLLKERLLPYQLDGIAFAVGQGRSIIADDMKFGKTIQGIGVAELLAQDADISKVLIICPASLKAQWRLERERFTHRSCQLVIRTAEERASLYDDSSFFTVCNYERESGSSFEKGQTRESGSSLEKGQMF
ncbi:MAG: SNF2-related protein [Thermodesulfobacteriota bacterium]|nr:SNF2-related protein [Thermodesulfobacteriota bacterium]